MGDERKYGRYSNPKDALLIKREAAAYASHCLLYLKLFPVFETVFRISSCFPHLKAACPLGRLFPFRKGEDEFGADSLGADDIDVLIVCGDSLLDDGQPQPGSFFILAAG